MRRGSEPRRRPSEGAEELAVEWPDSAPGSAWIERHRDAWTRLALERRNAFLTPEWYEDFLRHYGGVADPALAAVHEPGGRLVGLLPLVRRGRELRFAGAGLGDLFHPVSSQEDEAAVAAAVGSRLGRRDFLVLDHVLEGADWPPALRAAAPRRMAAVSSRGDVLPLVELGGIGWEEFLGARSRNFRSQVRRRLRAVEDAGGRFRRTLEAGELDADWDVFVRLHDARWSARGGSTLSTERSRAFHREFAGSLLERGLLRLWFLELDGEAVAAWYGWSFGGRYAYYLAGFAPDREKLAPGFVLLSHTVRAAIEEGAVEYDLLRGGESYKSRFAGRERRVETVVNAPAWSGTRLLAASEALAWRSSRRLPDGLRHAGQSLYRRVRTVMPTGKLR